MSTAYNYCEKKSNERKITLNLIKITQKPNVVQDRRDERDKIWNGTFPWPYCNDYFKFHNKPIICNIGDNSVDIVIFMNSL